MLSGAVAGWSAGSRVEAASSTGATADVDGSMKSKWQHSSCGCWKQNANVYIVESRVCTCKIVSRIFNSSVNSSRHSRCSVSMTGLSRRSQTGGRRDSVAGEPHNILSTVSHTLGWYEDVREHGNLWNEKLISPIPMFPDTQVCDWLCLRYYGVPLLRCIWNNDVIGCKAEMI